MSNQIDQQTADIAAEIPKNKPPLIVRFFKGLLPWKGDRFLEALRKIIFLIALVVFIGSALYIGDYYYKRNESETLTKAVADLYNPVVPPSEEQVSNLPEGYNEKFANLYEINQDIIGWINVPGTDVNFPVMQAEDNDHYLYKNIHEEHDSFGVPFLDFRNKITQEEQSTNLVIYGHHMRGKKVFGQLINYKELDFYKEHPLIKFDSVYQDMDWKIVSVFYANVLPEQDNGNIFDYQNYINFSTDEEFNGFIKEVQKRSVLNTGVDVQPGDQLLTLSTCAYEFDQARFVVVARKVREGESTDAAVDQATMNPTTLYPDIWYKMYPKFTKPTFEDATSSVVE